ARATRGQLQGRVRPRCDAGQIRKPRKQTAAKIKEPLHTARRRDGRVAEGARLESVFRGNSNVGSNPTLSASSFEHQYLSIPAGADHAVTGSAGLSLTTTTTSPLFASDILALRNSGRSEWRPLSQFFSSCAE